MSKVCSVCRCDLPLAAFSKRKASRDGLNYRCRECSNAYGAVWRVKNPDAFKQWREGHEEERADYWRRWYAENREHRAASYQAWRKANPHVVNALIAKRNAAKKRATPPWANHDAIRVFYAEAARLTRETGIRHEVDHIHPLQGVNFCGLHWEGNLQILTRSENARKKNKLPSVAA